MAVKIKLKRMGKMRSPHYRVVIADSRTKRDGRAIEEIGKYHPTYDPSVIEIDTDRAQYWLGVGAQPTEAVVALLKVTGDWQKFKGLPGTEGTLRFAEPKVKQGQVPFTAAGNDATTGRGRTEAKTDAKVEVKADAKVEAPAKADAKVEAPAKADAKVEAPVKADAKVEAPAEADAKVEAPAKADATVEAPAEPKAEEPAAEAATPAVEAPAEPVAEAAAPEASAADAPAEA